MGAGEMTDWCDPDDYTVRMFIIDGGIERLRNALRYIAGYDVAGYDAHLRSEDVAEAALDD